MSKIDWTKPLEHVDGTPLLGKKEGPHYALTREDGLAFVKGQYSFDPTGIFRVFVDVEGRPNNGVPPIVRNRADSEWGAEIEVNGVRPDWLRATDKVDVRTRGGWIYSRNGASDVPPEDWAWTHYNGAPCIRAIRLPADHPYYLATSRGFTYWPGGDAAPGDWDGGEVLLRDGDTALDVDSNWQRGYAGNPSLMAHLDIIGYCRKVEPLPVVEQPEGDTVTIARMTETEAAAWIAGRSYIESAHHTIHAFRELGLIREETRAERFTRETGFRVTPDVEAALEWERG